MGFWSRIKALFSPPPAPPDAGWIVRGGKSLRWARDRLPMQIVLHPSAASYYTETLAAVRGLNSAGVKLFMLPGIGAAPEMIETFEDETRRARLRSTVMLTGDGEYLSGDRHLADTDFRFDTRSGEIWNALVKLPSRQAVINSLGQQLAYQMVLHELAHCLGLDHDTNPLSIMWPRVTTSATQLMAEDVARLRDAYGARTP